MEKGNKWSKKKKPSLTTNCIWMEEPLHHFDLQHLQLWLAF